MHLITSSIPSLSFTLPALQKSMTEAEHALQASRSQVHALESQVCGTLAWALSWLCIMAHVRMCVRMLGARPMNMVSP